jgi:hypothetical protein
LPTGTEGAARRSRIRNAALVLAGLAAACVLGEAGLRIAGFAHASLYVHDPRRGWTLRPGVASWVRTEAGRTFVRTSRAGFRDREHTLDKAPGTVRIAVLGDSFAEALQVPAEQAFWSVLERQLARCPAYGGRPVDVLNFGVGGYGTAQELLTLRDTVWPYAPDVVLLAFYTENDVLNNARAANPTRADEAPYFVYRDGRLRLEEPRAGASLVERAYRRPVAWTADLAARSRVVQLVHAGTRGRAQGAEQEDQRRRLLALGVSDPAAAPYRAATHPALIEAWRVTEGLLAAVRDETRARGARFWIVTLSNSPQVFPDPGVRRAFMREIGVDDLLYPDRRIREFARRQEIPVVTLAVPLAEHAERHGVFLHGFPTSTPGVGHWNDTGHRVAGEIIAAELCAAGLPAAASVPARQATTPPRREP